MYSRREERLIKLVHYSCHEFALRSGDWVVCLFVVLPNRISEGTFRETTRSTKLSNKLEQLVKKSDDDDDDGQQIVTARVGEEWHKVHRYILGPIWRRFLFIVRPFCNNFEPRFSFQLCVSLLGRVKSMKIVVLLWSDTSCKPLVDFCRRKYYIQWIYSELKLGLEFSKALRVSDSNYKVIFWIINRPLMSK